MKKGRVIAIAAVILVLAAGCWKFHDIYEGAKGHFPENTKVNGVDCSGLTVDQTKDKLTKEWNGRTFTIEKDGKTIGEIKGIDYKYDIDDQIESKMNANPFKTVYNALSKKPHAYKVSMKAEKQTDKVKKQIKSFDFLDADYKTKTKDAYVSLKTNEFKIVKEVYGDNIDKKRFSKKVDKCIASGKFSLEYDPKDYYDLPEVKEDDEKLAEYKAWCEEHLSQEITYKFYDGDYTLTPKELNSVLSFDEDDKPSVSDKKLAKVVKNLAWNYNTAYSNRKFKSHSGQTVVVYSGDYGWMLDQKKECKRLKKIILSGENKTLDPIWKQEPYYKDATKSNDIGDTYIEVSIGQQTVWYVEKGKTKLEAPVVTGNVSKGSGTPGGTYQIEFLQRNTTLKGFNYDGTPYESPVSYWMPFNGGIGLHDAPWRGSFGGSEYLSGGSHGCVNMPVGDAAALYYMIEPGVPVVVY